MSGERRTSHIQALGRFELTRGGGPVALGGAKRRALLAVLAAHHGRPVSVDRLIDELWGDATPARSRDTLQSHVAHLRRSLGAGDLAIERGPAGYSLRVGGPRNLDLLAFDVAVDEAKQAAAEGDPTAAREALAAALACWGGRPFDGVDDLPSVDAERVRLRQLHHDVVEAWAASSLDQGLDPTAVVGPLESVLDEDPWRERATGLLMTALYRTGRQVDALAAYDRLRRGLADQLGLVPSPELQALEGDVLRQVPSLGPVAASPLPSLEPVAGGADPRRVLPFVGRDAELARLRALLERTVAGERGLALVVGEPGAGKTRLARELAMGARSAGVSVLWGRCDEDPLAPYHPFVEALGSRFVDLAASPGPEVDRVRGGTGRFERLRLFDAVVRMLQDEAPAVLVVDDVHLADQASMALLRHVVRTAHLLPLLVVLTCRSTEAGSAAAVNLLADAGQDDTGVLDLRLDGLAEDDVAALVRAAAPDAGAEAVGPISARLWRSTGGNPFFVRELLQDAVDRAALDPEGSLGEDLELPATVRDAIAARFVRLDPPKLERLRVAAVVGEEFDLDVVASVLDIGDAEALDLLEDGVRAGVLVSTSVDRFRFAHSLLRRCLLDEVSASRRVRIHQQVGLALEQLRGATVEAHLPELAHHFGEAAGGADADRAVDYAHRAGLRALEVLAYEEAAQQFQRALDGMGFARPGDDAARCELLLRLGDARNRSGDAAEAAGVLASAAAMASRMGDHERLVAAALAYGGDLVEPGVSDRRQVLLLEQALAQLPAVALPLRARVTARLAEATEYERGGRCSRFRTEAVALARASGDPVALAAALLADASIHVPGRRGAARLATATELAELAAARGDEELDLLAEGWRLVGLLEEGDGDGFAATLGSHGHRAGELGQPLYQWGATGFEAMFAIVQGRFAEGEALAAEAYGHGRRVFPVLALQNQVAQVLAVRWCQGRIQEVGELVLQTAHTSPLPIWSAVPTWVRFQMGRTEEAAAGLRSFLVEHHPDVLEDAYGLCCLALLAEVSAGCGDEGTSRLLYDSLATMAPDCVVVGRASVCLASVDRFRGLAAAHLGMLDTAVEHLRTAIAFDRRLGAQPFEVIAAGELAAVLERRGGAGDAAEAEGLRRSAGRGASALGMAVPVAAAR